MEHRDVTLVIAAHKLYKLPDDPIYLPLEVGASLNANAFLSTRDNEGVNISEKNPLYCELTALYWAWKNLDSDYIGMVQYRRYFAGKNREKDPYKRILTGKELSPMLHSFEIFVPQKRHYYIETLYSHYAHTHGARPLDVTRTILAADQPAYLNAFDAVMRQRSGYMFNMFIMTKSRLDQYCSWLFPILETLEKQIDVTGTSSFQARYIGRVSELLLNVWLLGQEEHNKLSPGAVRELPYVMTEQTPWLQKGMAFLSAKFLHRKYSKSQ